jgi:hypothetical protein
MLSKYNELQIKTIIIKRGAKKRADKLCHTSHPARRWII